MQGRGGGGEGLDVQAGCEGFGTGAGEDDGAGGGGGGEVGEERGEFCPDAVGLVCVSECFCADRGLLEVLTHL